MSDVLKVLMMGGQRAGKSSIIAGLIDTMTNGPVKDFVSVRDITQGARGLDNKIRNIKYHLRTSFDKLYLIDDNERTDIFQDYTLQLSVPQTDSTMDIVFTDAAGEFYDLGKQNDSEVRNYVKSYDVFIIAVDTPYLMEAVNPDNDLCHESINRSYNHVNDIHSFLTDLDDKEGTDAKLVIFVPLKCEKWIHEGRAEEVVNRVTEVYKDTICALSQYTNVEVDIMPIQTVGSIEFYEHLEPLICIKDGGAPRRCSLTDDETTVRFENGDEEPVNTEHHQFREDPSAVVRIGLSLIRPNTWYKTVDTAYKPENCDQLAYYILDFFLAKVLFAKKIENIKKSQSRWKIIKYTALAIGLELGGIFFGVATYLTSRYLEKKFGTFTLEQLQALMEKIRKGGYLRRNCQGIRTIKESKLKSL